MLEQYTVLGVIGLVVPLFLMFFAVSILRRHSTKLQVEIAQHKEATNETMSKSLLKLIGSVSPRIIYCPDTASLTEECVTMITKAADDYREHRRIVEDEGAQNIDEQKKEAISFINIYGAANIETPGEGSAENHHEKFHSSLDSAMQSGLRVQRYINLPVAEGFASRSMVKKIEYFEWIDHEIEIIKKSGNYDLVMNPRAPGWEGTATMATNSGIVEIKGGGKSGLAIYDSALSASIRFSVRRDLQGASVQNQVVVNSHKNLEILEAIRDEMKKNI